MDTSTTTLNAQLVTTGLKYVFYDLKCVDRKIRSVEKFWFGCQWKRM